MKKQYFAAFDEDEVMLDYSLSEEDVREWADDRFKKEMHFIGIVEFSNLERVKIGWSINDE